VQSVWKAVKEWLYEHDGIDAASPKSVIRFCREIGLPGEDEAAAALEMADDRNPRGIG